VVGTGEVRWDTKPNTNDLNAGPDLVLDVAELIWESIPD
jgi:hypothetical protein